MNDFIGQAVDVVVLVAAVCVALTNIYKFFKKPVDSTKEKIDENRKKHDDELTQSITASVMA